MYLLFLIKQKSNLNCRMSPSPAGSPTGQAERRREEMKNVGPHNNLPQPGAR